MAGIPFIETHVRFYDLQHPTLEYGWRRRGVKHHILKAIEPIQAQRPLSEGRASPLED